MLTWIHLERILRTTWYGKRIRTLVGAMKCLIFSVFISNKQVIWVVAIGYWNLFSKAIVALRTNGQMFQILISNSNLNAYALYVHTYHQLSYECENHVTHGCIIMYVYWDKSAFGNRYTCCQVQYIRVQWVFKGMSILIMLFLFTTFIIHTRTHKYIRLFIVFDKTKREKTQHSLNIQSHLLKKNEEILPKKKRCFSVTFIIIIIIIISISKARQSSSVIVIMMITFNVISL